MNLLVKPPKKATLTPKESMERYRFLEAWAKAACKEAKTATPPIELDLKATLARLKSVFVMSSTRKPTELQLMMPADIIANPDKVLKAVEEAESVSPSSVSWLSGTCPTVTPK